MPATPMLLTVAVRLLKTMLRQTGVVLLTGLMASPAAVAGAMLVGPRLVVVTVNGNRPVFDIGHAEVEVLRFWDHGRRCWLSDFMRMP